MPGHLIPSPKIVFSRSLGSAEDKRTRIIRANLHDEILELKQEPGKDILVGGVSIASQLIELGLVDEYRFVVGPILAGIIYHQLLGPSTMSGHGFQDVAKSANVARLKALMADLAAGLAFAKLASERTTDSAKRERNRRNARKAYESVVKFAKSVTFSSTEESALNDSLAKLKSALEQFRE